MDSVPGNTTYLWVCNNGEYILDYTVCDNEVDCGDESDEINCASGQCENVFILNLCKSLFLAIGVIILYCAYQ